MKFPATYAIIGSILFVIACVLAMATLHERHYRQRRTIIDPSKPIEERIAAIEKILVEDRYT